MFWMLITLGFVGLTPCVLLPEWRQYEALALAEQAELYRSEALRSAVDHKQAAFEALRTDPAVIARLAQRELSYEATSQRLIPVSMATENRASDGWDGFGNLGALPTGVSFAHQQFAPPALIADAMAILPTFDYDAVFCDDRTRSIILAMSFGMIGLAFLLFCRPSTVGASHVEFT